MAIAEESASNSGYIAATNSFTGGASWTGENRLLSVDVSMFGPGVTVSSMTYGGAPCTFIGGQSTVTSFGRVENWRIIETDTSAPASGSNTLVVTLSGSVAFAVEWVAYSGVNQTAPTEGFNSAQATNAGAADAIVNITSTTDKCWPHIAIATTDTTISASQNSRNNASGALGSGADEDTGPVTPAGVTAMSYTGVGAAQTWAVAGYAIRPTVVIFPEPFFVNQAVKAASTY